MGTTTTINARQLAPKLLEAAEKHRGAIKTAAIAAARKFQALLMRRCDELGITDQGTLKSSWRAEKTAEGAIVYSDCPYAGIVEMGARPHPVSKEGQDAIALWAIRKLGVDPDKAASVAFLICRKIAREGQAPKYLVAGVLDQAGVYFIQELTRVIKEAS